MGFGISISRIFNEKKTVSPELREKANDEAINLGGLLAKKDTDSDGLLTSKELGESAPIYLKDGASSCSIYEAITKESSKYSAQDDEKKSLQAGFKYNGFAEAQKDTVNKLFEEKGIPFSERPSTPQPVMEEIKGKMNIFQENNGFGKY